MYKYIKLRESDTKTHLHCKKCKKKKKKKNVTETYEKWYQDKFRSLEKNKENLNSKHLRNVKGYYFPYNFC